MLTKNLQSLEERHPRIAEEIKKMPASTNRRFVKNDRNIIVYQQYFHDKWLSLTSAYRPMAEAEAQVSQIDVSEAKFVFVLGEAGMYHIEALLPQIPDEAVILLISNSYENLRVVLESRDVTAILDDKRFVMIAYDNINFIKQAIHTTVLGDLYTIPTFAVIEHPMEARFQDDFFFQMKKFLHGVFTTSLANRNTTMLFEHWWSRNLLRNLPYLVTANAVGEMKDTWVDKPAIIVGAGPSLNKNIELLKDAKGKALILCVDTAYRILTRHGIKPDILITLDGSPMNAAHLEGCDYSELPILFDSYSHFQILENHKGAKIALSTVEFHYHWWEKVVDEPIDKFSLTQGGSVATAAFSFAKLMGADPIILTGIDLSYPQGQCYADGALHDSRTLDDMQRELYPVTDIYGEETYTTFDYMYYLKWFTAQGKDNDGSRKYINATEGGALRENFIIQPLAEVLEQYCQDDLPTEDWKYSIKNQEIDEDKICSIRKKLVRGRLELRAAIRYLKLMLSALEKYIGKVSEHDYADLDNLMQMVEKGNRELTSLSFAMSFMDCHSFDAIYRDVAIEKYIERDQKEFTESERTLVLANRSYKLFAEFHDIAVQSKQMHDEGIDAFDSVFVNLAVGVNKL